MLLIPLKVQKCIIGHLAIDTESLLNFLSEEKEQGLIDFSHNLAAVIENKKAQEYLGESFFKVLAGEQRLKSTGEKNNG